MQLIVLNTLFFQVSLLYKYIYIYICSNTLLYGKIINYRIQINIVAILIHYVLCLIYIINKFVIQIIIYFYDTLIE